MKSQCIVLAFCLLFLSFPVQAQDSTTANTAYQVLQFQNEGTARLGSGLAQIRIPKGFKYLDPKQSHYVLETLWQNPPSPTMGMLFPDYANDTFPATWAIEISYSDEGHVDDEDAADIDYEDLLEQMQEEAEDGNEARKEAGYQTISLLGWASTPFYDAKNKKLHWAKRLRFGTDSTETLNYNIRVLGKAGVLVVNAIGSPEDLPEIKQELDGILTAVDFTEGNAYADYKEGVDKKASYGIAGLIAGGILMKTGLLAKIGIFLLKFSKLIIVGLVAGASALWKWITGKKKNSGNNSAPQIGSEDPLA
ncbi:MAG TPA: DUF2167 domain-containing protein [Catalimonadaceae bacterium]|nr:DUF2167 domain-containing protein [Catalimonadaceae bacterium]HPI10680.1 DUF2167 domain-containing protein [Catalimonadaceae bacterium]